MAEHNELGEYGEAEALKLLREKGFRIRETNWMFGKDEVDIIAEKDDLLIFVEVKTRRNDRFGAPWEFVSKAKQKHLIRAANVYVERKDLFLEIRFDIIAVTLQPELHLEHLQEAFHP